MHEPTCSLFKRAILDSLPHLHPLVGQHITHYQVWKRSGDAQWRGRSVIAPGPSSLSTWVATRICRLTATGECPLMANSPRFVVAFRSRKEPFGQHDFAGSRASIHQQMPAGIRYDRELFSREFGHYLTSTGPPGTRQMSRAGQKGEQPHESVG